MPRGGPRRGTSGRAYTNRSDLNTGTRLPVTAGPSQGYGQRAAQERAQQAIPMGTPAVTTAPPSSGGPVDPTAGLPPLLAPTQNPNEPLTAGLPSGPGPGPEALPPGATGDDLLLRLKAAYAVFPTRELAELIEMEEASL